MVLNIIFSFNRAMQLDYFLNSGLERIKFSTETVVLYHTTGEHEKGYKKLIEKYSKHDHIRFVERTPNKLSTYLKFRLNKEQKKQYLKGDNFKPLMEQIMRDSTSDFVMFNTDDGFWTNDVYFEEDIQNLIIHNPSNITYRFYVGDNLDEFPSFVQKWGKYYLWDYYSEQKITHWTYPFAVDGTVYSRIYCLDMLKNLWYHNPVSLESSGVDHAMRWKLFGIGLSPEKSVLIGTKLNRVSTSTLNPTIHLSVEDLNEKYLKGYSLEMHFPKIDNSNLVPLEVNLVKENVRETIYRIDEFGMKVQENLGAEGSKSQME